jgi:hypothetical protein
MILGRFLQEIGGVFTRHLLASVVAAATISLSAAAVPAAPSAPGALTRLLASAVKHGVSAPPDAILESFVTVR